MSRCACVLLAITLIACGGKKETQKKKAKPAVKPTPVQPKATSDAGPPPKVAVEPFKIPEELSEEKALLRVGALAAWEGVIQRYKFLARRGGVGIIWGLVGKEIGAYRWLIDETGGSGSLAVRLAGIDKFEVAEGDRLVAWGSWKVDEQRKWIWDVRKLAKLPAHKKSKPQLTAFEPGHQIQSIETRPKGSVPVSVLKRHGDITFEVIAPPKKHGDGWLIGDKAKWRKIAYLYLPGERRVYGGQEYFSTDELWQLEEKTRYTVKVKRFHKRTDGKPSKMHAITPPRKILKPKN